jgi:hypothetical protein
MNPIRMSAGTLPVPNELNTVSPAPNGVEKMHLLHEVLSRARMRLPQAGRTASTEATRSARIIALEAHRRAARELGSY